MDKHVRAYRRSWVYWIWDRQQVEKSGMRGMLVLVLSCAQGSVQAGDCVSAENGQALVRDLVSAC